MSVLLLCDVDDETSNTVNMRLLNHWTCPAQHGTNNVYRTLAKAALRRKERNLEPTHSTQTVHAKKE